MIRISVPLSRPELAGRLTNVLRQVAARMVIDDRLEVLGTLSPQALDPLIARAADELEVPVWRHGQTIIIGDEDEY